MTRIIPGLLLAGAWLLLLLKGNFLLFWAVVVLICFIGGREFIRMAFPSILYERDRVILSAIIALPAIISLFIGQSGYSTAIGLVVPFCALICFVMYHYTRFERPLVIISRGLLGIVFIGFFGSHLVMIWSLPEGAHWLVILSAVTAGSDSFAYWVGSSLGKRKLCPNISPNKTVEGALGGIAGGLLACLLFYFLLDVQASLLTILAIGCFLSVTGMFGDLLESIIKRGTNTKDSGTILRGHGGVLDRADSLLMSAPVLYCTLVCMGL